MSVPAASKKMVLMRFGFSTGERERIMTVRATYESDRRTFRGAELGPEPARRDRQQREPRLRSGGGDCGHTVSLYRGGASTEPVVLRRHDHLRRHDVAPLSLLNDLSRLAADTLEMCVPDPR